MLDHVLEICHSPLTERTIKLDNYSSLKFSLLYQILVFNAQVKFEDIELNDVYFDVEDAINACFNLINDSGSFTTTGWYKRSELIYQTIKHQQRKKEISKYSLERVAKVSSGKFAHYACVITPTNMQFQKVILNYIDCQEENMM